MTIQPDLSRPDLCRLGIAVAQGVVRLVHGEVLVLPRTEVDHVFVIRRGAVLSFEGGSARLVAAPGVIGLGELIAGERWRSLIVAHGPTEVQALPAQMLGRRMAEIPATHRRLLAGLAQEATPHQRAK